MIVKVKIIKNRIKLSRRFAGKLLNFIRGNEGRELVLTFAPYSEHMYNDNLHKYLMEVLIPPMHNYLTNTVGYNLSSYAETLAFLEKLSLENKYIVHPSDEEKDKIFGIIVPTVYLNRDDAIKRLNYFYHVATQKYKIDIPPVDFLNTNTYND